MTERWASFDCYGTLIDWDTGIAGSLAGLMPGRDRGELLAAYHRAEPGIQAGGPLPYREVLARAARAVAEALGHPLQEGAEEALAESLPSWPPFPEAPAALGALRDDGWRLAVLSNTDPDLLSSSLKAIGVPVDLTITVREAGSYKPSPGHWRAFVERGRVDPADHVHVAASLFHDIEACARLGVRAIWINRLGERTDLPRVAELPDLSALPAALRALG